MQFVAFNELQGWWLHRAADNAYLKKFVQAWIRWHFLRIEQKTGEARKAKHALNLLRRRKVYMCFRGWSDYAYNKREFEKPEFLISSRAIRRGLIRRTFYVRPSLRSILRFSLNSVLEAVRSIP